VERERKRATLVERRVELERVRGKYLEAAKDRKVLDKLKERQQGDYYEHQKDEEFKSIDDMNTSGATRARL
jgi:flagellar export protein FliJ